MQAISIHTFGSADVLQLQELPIPTPGPGEVLVRNQAIGVNFIDIYQRRGTYPGATTPRVLGIEGAGSIVALGDEGIPANITVGLAVAYIAASGAYAEYTVVPADRVVPLPAGLTSTQAVAALQQGLTAHLLVHDAYRIQAGDTVLIHAGAGGVGRILIQLAKLKQARVITTVSTDAKLSVAQQAGADEVIVYTRQNFVEAVHQFTDGKGVHAVYDSVGKTTFADSFKCLSTRGTLVLYGAASGAAPDINPQHLMQGSFTLIRPSLPHYIADRDTLLTRAQEIFQYVLAGKLALHIGQSYALTQVKEAHQTIEQRLTTGKTILIP